MPNENGILQEPRARRLTWTRRAAIAALGLVVGLAGPAASTAAAAPTAGCTTSMDSAETSSEASFLAQLNDLRRSHGKPALVANHRIAGPAGEWSATMSQQNWLHHARDTGADDGVEPSQDYVTLVTSVVPNWRRVGENVGVSGMTSWCSAGELDTASRSATTALHQAFVRSDGHYANMIGDFNQVGIGVEIDSDELWVTVRFAKGDLPATPSPTQAAVAKDYVNAVYELFLGRTATSAERDRWAPAIIEGRRSALTNALAVSDEWAGSRIADLYTQILGRSADTQGRLNWVAAVANGKRLEDVAAAFYGSPEYYTKVGATNRQFVESLYTGILGRGADGSGLNFWLTQLQSGVSRHKIAAGFYKSVESRQDRVRSLYRVILGRDVDPAGLRTWSVKLISSGDVVLAATLATSQEFFGRATR